MSPNPLRGLARTRMGYRMFLRMGAVTEAADSLMRRASRGRLGAMDLVGLPSVRVTVPGRRSGVPGTVTLLAVPDEDRLLLVGSNWARPSHPDWSANLIAADKVSVRQRNEHFSASVRLLSGIPRDDAWRTILAFWPNYQIAQRRAHGRSFRVFELKRIS